MTTKEEKLIINNNKPRRGRANRKMDTNSNKASVNRDTKSGFYPKLKRYRIALLIMSIIAAAVLLMILLVDVFPSDLLAFFILIMFLMLGVCSALFASKFRWKRIVGIILAAVYVFLFSTSVGFMSSTFSMLNKISDAKTEVTGPIPKTVNICEEPFNLYITGIDQWAKEKGEDLERSDVNMLVTVNPLTKKILLTSIPRDTYVKLHTAQQMDKLTHTGIYGVDETLKTVEDWLDIDINYYVKMNFTGARDIINAMGGVMVYSPVDFTSSIKGYEYHKGWNDLNGKEAIYFARERKAFEGQDAMRIENQQRVMEAIIKKMSSSTTLLMNYDDIMDAAGEQMSTNLSPKELSSLARMQLTDLAAWDVETQKIEGENDSDYVASLTQSMKFDVYKPSEISVNSCTNSVMRILNPTEAELQEIEEGRSKSFFANAIRRILEESKKDE